MSFLGRLSGTDTQNLTFPRRELPGKLLALGVALLLPGRRREIPVTQIEVQTIKSAFSDRPEPEFKIGDRVAQDWVDEFDQNIVDFGEVVGACYLPVDGCYYKKNTWVYYIYWTHSTCGLDFCYPNFDGEMTAGSTLRLVSNV